MNYKDFYKLLLNNRLISNIWEYVLALIEEEIKEKEHKNDYLIIFAILFSFVDDGNICVSLNKNILKNKFLSKSKAIREQLLELEDDKAKINKDFDLINETATTSVDNYLDEIKESNLSFIIGNNKIFNIEDNYLYIRKYNDARKSIISSISRLFSSSSNDALNFNYHDWLKKYSLSNEQEDIIKKGINHNLVVTGGPGTGKTTSILFLLIALLLKDINTNIHLCAPSGKASNRMKESILKGLNDLEDSEKNKHPEIVNKIENLKESTIHSLLEINSNTHAFSYNKYHQFEKSIFVIDEASMIDICLFSSLLDAIPTGARIFIMGDKNQLPSVEAGAVFAELISMPELEANNIVRLIESKRFLKGSEIYNLSIAVNDGLNLNIDDNKWLDYEQFEIKEVKKNNYPIYYFKNYKDDISESRIVQNVIYKWGSHFYKDLQNKCMDLDPSDLDNLTHIFNESEASKILTAENESVRGVKNINDIIKKLFIDKKLKTSVDNEYAGQIMMINKNNKSLDLYNGDSGLLVTFKNDPTLYFMLRKSTTLVSEEGKKIDKIFKLGDFTFYPFRLITRSEIDLAYAITIHKSQGSDYPSILVILPSRKGHPLLNRQIIYTAITRTRGNTYLLTNIDILNEAKDTVLTRDTNIATKKDKSIEQYL